MTINENDLCWMSATALSGLVSRREVTPLDIAQACIDRIERVNPQLNALVYHNPEQVLSDARVLTDKLAGQKTLQPLYGIPYTVKESLPVAGLPVTSGLVPMRDCVATEDAVAYTRLKASGGLFLGKTNPAEAGYSASSKNHLYGTTHNAWARGMTAGGSTGGGGAAVAAGLGQLAQGSDGGGSVRIPAAINGVVGFKPSIGRIPIKALGGRFYTFIFNGPITRTVADAALMFQVMSGPDESDPLSLPDDGRDYMSVVKEELPRTRIAWSPDLGHAEVDPEILAICEKAVLAFAELGCDVEEKNPGWQDVEEAMWNGLWAPTYGSLHDAYDWEEWRGQVDDELISLIQEGSRMTSDQLCQADSVRGQMWDQYAGFMKNYDLLITPTLNMQTFPVDEFCPASLKDAPLRHRLLGWLQTYQFNMLGVPAITVPAGFTKQGLPVGLQIVGRLHGDAEVLRAAAAFERIRPWAHLKPSYEQERG